MTTALEHMQADFTADLAANGQAVILDGVSLQAFVYGLEITPSEFERTVLERQRLSHLLGAIAEKVPGQVIMLDGARWEVVTHKLGTIGGTLIMQRSVG